MALWQFQMYLVPQEKIGPTTCFTVDDFNAARWWSERQPPEDYRKQFADILPAADCPYDGGLWWGTSSGNNIEVLIESGAVEDIVIRCDCRTFDPAYSLRIFDLAVGWSCGLIDQRYFTVLPNERDAFIDAISASPNRQFMADPEYWLPKLAKEVADMEGHAEQDGAPDRNGE